MRQEKILNTYVKYSELTEAQKLKALEKYHDWNVDFDWWTYTYEDQTKILELLGFYKIDINFSGFWSQGDGASFTGFFEVPKTVKELKDRIKAVKNYAPNFDLHNFSALRFSKEEKEEGTIEIYRIGHHYSHSNTVTCNHEELKQFVRSFSDSIYRTLEKEHEYLTSREAIEESLISNEVEFLSNSEIE